MTAAALLAELRALGATAGVEGDRLTIDAPISALPARLLNVVVDAGDDTTVYHTLALTWAFPVTGAGTKTFVLEVSQTNAAPLDVGYGDDALTALYVPFGSGGGSTLGGGEPARPAPVPGHPPAGLPGLL